MSSKNQLELALITFTGFLFQKSNEISAAASVAEIGPPILDSTVDALELVDKIPRSGNMLSESTLW